MIQHEINVHASMLAQSITPQIPVGQNNEFMVSCLNATLLFVAFKNMYPDNKTLSYCEGQIVIDGEFKKSAFVIIDDKGVSCFTGEFLNSHNEIYFLSEIQLDCDMLTNEGWIVEGFVFQEYLETESPELLKKMCELLNIK